MTGALRDEPRTRSVLPVRRFVWRPWEVAAVPAEPSSRLAGRRIAVLGGSADSADRVLAALRAAGAVPARLACDADVAEFVRTTGRLDGIIDLNYERPFDLSRPGGWVAQLLQTIELLRLCYDDWRAESDAEKLFYLAVTRMDGRHGFSDGPIAQPLGGLWAGLAKGLPREFDTVNVRVLDFPAGPAGVEPLDAEMARTICRELYRWGHFEIGYHGGRRYTLRADQVTAPDPVLELGPGDVVVMSGGSRGIGFALARHLAAEYRCRVIVSGRHPEPDPDDPVGTLSDEQFRAHRDRELIEAARHRTLAATRAKLARAEWNRQLTARLAAARADGLDIGYQQCDVTDAGQVRALLAAAGPRLAGVVHNAGVDTPVRLPAKTPEVVRRTVEVKVTGLLNLLAALPDCPAVRFFSTAGSLAGRWGGMTGQLEYGAANDALSRIGLWAAGAGAQPGRALRVPVTTLCWPTWERLGIITNYEAALAYTSAMRVEEGLRHWAREIRAGNTGEVSFVGEFGNSLLPSLIRGYPPCTGLAGIERLVNRLLFTGRPIRFASGSILETEIDLAPELARACGDFRVDGAAAIPLSVLFECVRALGDWVRPEAAEPIMSAIRDIRVDLAAIRVHEGSVRLRAIAEGRWVADRTWEVTVLMRRGTAEVAQATLRYGPSAGSAETPTAFDTGATSPAAVRLRWNGQAFRLGRWSPDARSAEVEPDRMRDLVLGVPAPLPELPLNQLETLLHETYRRQACTAVRWLTIDSIDIPAPLSGSAGRVAIDGDRATAYTSEGAVRLAAQGIRFRKG